MPTEIARSSAPSSKHAETRGTNSRDHAPLSITALTLVAILVVAVHAAGADLFRWLQAHAAVSGQVDDLTCPAEAPPSPPALPFD